MATMAARPEFKSTESYGQHQQPRLIDITRSEQDIWEDSPSSPEDIKFDVVVGTLEDLLMDDEFLDLQNTFMEKNCMHFTDDDENKFIYMDLFNAYTARVEKFINKKLKSVLPWFHMPEFFDMLKTRKDADGDVFDMLASLGDFTIFKEMMLSYKHEREGTSIDLSGLIAVKSTK